MNNRLPALKKLLQKESVDALLVSSVSNITYLTHYSGFSNIEREAFLLITKNANYIITDSRYSEAVRVLIRDFKLLEITHTAPLKDLLEKMVKKHKLKTVGFESDNITVAEYKKFRKYFKLKAISLATIRIQKTKEEIQDIQNACLLGDKAFQYVLKHIRVGVSEKEIAHVLETFVRKEGHAMSFETIVAFGENAATPHHQTSNKKLTPNNFVLMDFGVRYNNYCSDMTRTIFFGKANAEQKRMYETVLESQRLAIEALNTKYQIQNTSRKPVKASEIDKVARNHIVESGYPSIPHSLGHGIGIEVHEPPSLSPKSFATLKSDMIFSIEPGIYIPQSGGVRIEDLVVMEKGSLKILTKAPKHFIEIK